MTWKFDEEIVYTVLSSDVERVNTLEFTPFQSAPLHAAAKSPHGHLVKTLGHQNSTTNGHQII